MPSSVEIGQAILSGLLLGGAYAVLSAGFSLTWGVTKVINLSHTVFALVGSYIAFWLLRFLGVEPILSLVIIIPLLFLCGLAMHGIIKQTAKRAKEITPASLVLTFGLFIVTENILLITCKADPRLITTSYSGKALFLDKVALPISSLISFALAAVTIAALYLFLHYTYTGKAVQAVWQDKAGAMLSGIDTSRVTAITYGVALASAGVGGVCMGLIYAIDPTIHLSWLIFIFLVTVLGGVGSIIGAAIAGLLMGLVIGLTGAFLPYAWVNLVLFISLIILLLVRPQGLFQR